MSYKRGVTSDSKWETEYNFLQNQKDLLDSRIGGLEEEKSKVMEMMEEISSKNIKIPKIDFEEYKGVEKEETDKNDSSSTIEKLKKV